MADTETTDDQEQQQAESAATDTGDATGAEKGGTSEAPAFTQADVDRIVAERLKREGEKADKKRQQEEAELESKKLEAEQQYKELAEKRADRIVALETEVQRIGDLEAQVEAANKALTGQLEALRDGVPAHILELISERDLPSQLDWLTKHRGEYVTGSATTKGVPPTPKGNSSGIPEEEKLKQAARTWRGV